MNNSIQICCILLSSTFALLFSLCLWLKTLVSSPI
uniref:Uncharacterized protein n=1 Tax=Arundo donax TaxID=35708 RepID=A0A0A9B0W9_ARUDO